MRSQRDQGIDFPANPFVALADFVIVLVLILIVTIVHQSISNSSLMERAAVASTQHELNVDVISSTGLRSLNLNESGNNRPMHRAEQDFAEIFVDGDLQRFRLRGALSFARGSATLTPEGKVLLSAFARQLAQRQGSPYHPETRPFKRVIINGNADVTEGDEKHVWALSVQRALDAVAVLRQQGVHPELLEASGRGAYEPVLFPDPAQGEMVAETNRRLDIIVVYSGNISLHFLINRRASSLSTP